MTKKIFENKNLGGVLDSMVFDFKSHRHYDNNGRLLVDQTLITKACVSEYYGQEIPNYEQLGLEPLKKYKVLRPAEELEKALPQFNNIPVLNKHIMDYADEPQKENRCGGLSNCTYKDGGVYADMNIWDKADIDRIESGELKDLSCGYRCQFIKESGEYNGEHYDLKMVDIMPNHLALVKKGRVDGAYVYDEDKGANMFSKLANLFKKLGIKDEDLEELKDEFKESDHPRSKDGKFTSGSGSNSGSSKEESYAEQAKKMQQGKEKGYEQYIPYIKQAIEKAKKEYSDKDEDTIKKMAISKAKSKIDATVSGHGMAYSEDIKKYVDNAFKNLEKSNGVGDNATPKERKMEENKDKDLTKDAAHEDKRKLIDEIGGILKGKVDEEIIRTILGKAEELAYNGSETSETDDAEPNKEDIVEETEEEKLKKIKDEAKEEAKKEMAELNAAKEEVEDVCGKIGTQDSKEAYYKLGCAALGLNTKGVCDSAFEPMFKGAVAVKKQGAKKAVVLDEEASNKIKKGFENLFDGLPKRKFN